MGTAEDTGEIPVFACEDCDHEVQTEIYDTDEIKGLCKKCGDIKTFERKE